MKNLYCENNLRKELQLLTVFATHSIVDVCLTEFWICLGFWFRIYQGSEHVWIYLKMSKYVWMCLHLPEWLLCYFPIVIPCLLERMVTYFSVYTKLEVIVWRNARLCSWRDKIWFFLEQAKVFDLFVLD